MFWWRNRIVSKLQQTKKLLQAIFNVFSSLVFSLLSDWNLNCHMTKKTEEQNTDAENITEWRIIIQFKTEEKKLLELVIIK